MVMSRPIPNVPKSPKTPSSAAPASSPTIAPTVHPEPRRAEDTADGSAEPWEGGAEGPHVICVGE